MAAVLAKEDVVLWNEVVTLDYEPSKRQGTVAPAVVVTARARGRLGPYELATAEVPLTAFATVGPLADIRQ
jgi:hypothetical protein